MQRFLPLTILFALILANGCEDKTKTPATAATAGAHIRVAAAISLKDSMTEIAAAFHKETSGDVVFDYGSSGELLGKIKNGAPIDAFISAGNAQVKDLDKAGMADMNTRRVVAMNALVLIVPASSAADARPAGFADLVNVRFKRVAAGEPKTVPAGQYAAEVFRSLKIDGALQERLIYGTNVRQVLDYVERGEVDAGVVYATDAKQSGSKVIVVATADPAWHEPIEFPGVVVKGSTNAAAAKAWLDYLGTGGARTILKGKGFTVPFDQGG